MTKAVLTIFLVIFAAGLVFAQVSDTIPEEEKAACDTIKTAVGSEQESPLKIEKMVFCQDVEEREPVNEATEFDPNSGRIYCWSNIINEGDSTSVTHVWYHAGEKKAEIKLPIAYPRNRVWSYKTIVPEWAGQWTVEVVTKQGEKLGEKNCFVK